MRVEHSRSNAKVLKLPVKALVQFMATATVSAFIASKLLGFQADYALFVLAFGLIALGVSGATAELRDIAKEQWFQHAPIPIENTRHQRRR